jgi:hypothetical protein
MKAQLCKCNNCNAIMVDMNPAEQPEFEILSTIIDMENIQEIDPDNPANLCENFWGCPNCKTDAHLIDIISISQLH